MTKSDAQKRANLKYIAKSTKTVNLRFMINTEADRILYEHLMSQENKNGYVKRLIREDMERNA